MFGGTVGHEATSGPREERFLQEISEGTHSFKCEHKKTGLATRGMRKAETSQPCNSESNNWYEVLCSGKGRRYVVMYFVRSILYRQHAEDTMIRFEAAVLCDHFHHQRIVQHDGIRNIAILPPIALDRAKPNGTKLCIATTSWPAVSAAE